MTVMSSSTRNRPTTSAGCSHPGNTARLMASGRSSRDECPQVRDEPKGGRQGPPGDGVGNPDQEQAESHGHAEAAVDDGLHEQVPADACPGFVERARRRRHPPIADQQDHPIPQLPALEQHEDHEHRHDPRARQRLEETRQVAEDGRGLQDDSDRLLTHHPQRVGLLDLADDVLDRSSEPSPRSRPCWPREGPRFCAGCSGCTAAARPRASPAGE